ncbi:MAG: esterase/lipase family protein [Myxococcota bacterium]
MKPRFPMPPSAAFALAATLVACGEDSAATDTCQLRHPIVLSHHWSSLAVCSDPLPSASCEARLPERYCADWRFDAELDREACYEWRIPEDERELPPYSVNPHDPALTRDMDDHYRYFSKAIVDRLEACGNEVYHSDKPPFASYAVRARSLRNTVLDALADSGADKVNLIGLSQGVQDARYMTAALPVDDADPDGPAMRDRVAGVVSLVGEDQGAESGSLLLALMAGENDGDWSVPVDYAGLRLEDMDDVLWRDGETDGSPYVLVEGYDPENPREYDLGPEEKLQALLDSVANLSMEYMRSDPDAGTLGAEGYESLRAYLGFDETGWHDMVPEARERDNGIVYMSYACQVRTWQPRWGDPTAHAGVQSLYGPNDGHVTVESQSFDSKGWPNFEHVHTMAGSEEGSGYNHMYLTGRGDDHLGPAEPHREPPPYGSSTPDFYEQVLRDMAARGL